MVKIDYFAQKKFKFFKTHQLRFYIKDTGIGISKEDQDRLFKSFSQVDASTTRRYGGTGLGLAITRAVAETRGGSLTFETSDEGTCFELVL